MGYVIQRGADDGSYHVWSTIVDDFVAIDCTKEEAVEFCVASATESIRLQWTRQADRALPPEEPKRLEELRRERAAGTS